LEEEGHEQVIKPDLVCLGNLRKRNRFGILPHEMEFSNLLVFSKRICIGDLDEDEYKEQALFSQLRDL